MNENKAIIIRNREYVYISNEKTANFEKDLFTVADILNKDPDEITVADRFQLLKIYHPAFHTSGKIENVMSFDSSATNCEFCQLMRAAAENNKMHICGYCYDYSQEHSFKGVNVLNRHTLNMVIMSSVEFSVDELRTLSVAYLNRVNSSGDVPNLTYARNMIKLCYAFPAVRFGFWAKNTAAVIAACNELGKPDNVVLVQSSYIIGKTAKKKNILISSLQCISQRKMCKKLLPPALLNAMAKNVKNVALSATPGNGLLTDTQI